MKRLEHMDDFRRFPLCKTDLQASSGGVVSVSRYAVAYLICEQPSVKAARSRLSIAETRSSPNGFCGA